MEMFKVVHFNDDESAEGRNGVERLSLCEERAAIDAINAMIRRVGCDKAEIDLIQRFVWNYEIFQYTVVTNGLIDTIPFKSKEQ